MVENNKYGNAQIKFYGCNAAELFTREIDESFIGVLSKNFVHDDKNIMQGFVSASVDGRPWSDTMWTRDAGVFLRELVQWGKYNYACLLADNLIELVLENSEGYFTFPEYFKYGLPGSGSELDGTSAIIIGMVMLIKSRIVNRGRTVFC